MLTRPLPRILLTLSALLALLWGCASETGHGAEASAAASAAELELAPPERGFQLESRGLSVEAGEDIRWCEVVVVPGEVGEAFVVDRIESALTAGAEDLIVTAAPLRSETGAIMDAGSRVPCTRAGEAFGEELMELTSTQLRYDDERMPAGVGRVVYGGQKLALDYHYVNRGVEPLVAKVKLNFHTTNRSELAYRARTASFENLTIYTPPGGRSAHLAECTVSEDLAIGELVRRTQARGTRFTVWALGGERDGELLWVSMDPNDTRFEFDEPLRLHEGEGLRFQCEYVNTTEFELRFGVNAQDEMCTLNALVWSEEQDHELSPQGCLLLDVDEDGVARN